MAPAMGFSMYNFHPSGRELLAPSFPLRAILIQ
jgi:hypothetical protein